MCTPPGGTISPCSLLPTTHSAHALGGVGGPCHARPAHSTHLRAVVVPERRHLPQRALHSTALGRVRLRGVVHIIPLQQPIGVRCPHRRPVPGTLPGSPLPSPAAFPCLCPPAAMPVPTLPLAAAATCRRAAACSCSRSTAAADSGIPATGAGSGQCFKFRLLLLLLLLIHQLGGVGVVQQHHAGGVPTNQVVDECQAEHRAGRGRRQRQPPKFLCECRGGVGGHQPCTQGKRVWQQAVA